jgi:hypothetical protein
MESQNNSNSSYGFEHGRRQRDQFDQGPYYYEQEYGRNQNNYTNRGFENDPDYSSVANNLSGQGRNYGYNQGQNSASNKGGRSYGQSYGQQHQGDYSRQPGRDNYQGRYDERQSNRYNDYSSDNNSRGFYNQNENRYNNNDDYYYNRDANDDRPYSSSKSSYEQRQDSAYQSSGHTEGFGHRNSSRNENDWQYEDEYRGGHGQNNRAFGKYGSR